MIFETSLWHLVGENSQGNKLCLTQKGEIKAIQNTKFSKNREN